jgi:hypothetical protein
VTAAGLGVADAAVLVATALSLLLPREASSGPRHTSRLAAPPLQTTGAFRDGLTPSPTATPSPTPTTTLPAAGRPSQRPNPALTFVGAPLFAQHGQTVTLDVRTAPNTDCSIDIAYPSAPELNPATSDSTGYVSWTWKVGKHVQPGSWPITVSCRSGNASTQITVR